MHCDLLTPLFARAVCDVVREAGQVICTYMHRMHTRACKSDHSLVTDADIASEQVLREKLHMLFPQAAIIAEETGGSEQGGYAWVIDPLDGTTNFFYGIPYFCISVALTWQGQPLVGVIYNPMTNECFYAIRDQGAFLNEQPIRVSMRTNLDNAFLAVGVPCAHEQRERFWQQIASVQQATYSWRKLGSAALDLAMVAAGRCDVVLYGTIRWWDVAAGLLLVTQAGGQVTDFGGQELTPAFTSLMASNRHLHEAVGQRIA